MHAIGFGPRFAVNRRGTRSTLFDFSGGVLPPGATLTRASMASVYDASGAIMQTAANVARFDRDPVTLALRGLLIEPAGSNVIARNTDWTDSYWSKSTLNASPGMLIETAASGTHSVRQAAGDVTYTAGQPMVVSGIAGERIGSAKRYLVVSLGTTPTFTATTFAIFDLANGTVTASGGAIAAAYPAGGGAWLCVLAVTPVGTAAAQQTVLRLNSSATTIASYVGDGTSGLNITQLQAEPGTVATSRIVTGASPGTRAADVLTLDWRSRGVADGVITVRYGFDDGSTQDATLSVSGGTASVPTTLTRRWLRRVQKI